jgi:hypothetical protein
MTYVPNEKRANNPDPVTLIIKARTIEELADEYIAAHGRPRTRADAEAEIAAINEEIDNLQSLVMDDIEALEFQRAVIEEELDDLPDVEENEEQEDEAA